MLKDKSFLTTFGPMNINFSQVYPKSRSLSSKSFSLQNASNLESFQSTGRNIYDGIYRLNPQGIDCNLNHSQRTLTDYNPKQCSEFYQNLFLQKKYPLINFSNRSEQKSNLFRSKSSSQVYHYKRLQMLQKINSILDERRSKQKKESEESEMKQKIHKKQFERQVIAKLDKLEKFLHKIKSQRSKQNKPKPKMHNQEIHKITKKQKTVQQQILQSNKSIKNQYLSALSELDKIKQQLIKVRSQAISVKQRNSLSKNKNQNPQNIQKYENPQCLRPIQKSSYEIKQVQHFQPSTKFITNFQQNKSIDNKFYSVNENFKQIRNNNHIGQNYTSLSYSTFHNKFSNQSANHHNSTSRPKITFSFKTKS